MNRFCLSCLVCVLILVGVCGRALAVHDMCYDYCRGAWFQGLPSAGSLTYPECWGGDPLGWYPYTVPGVWPDSPPGCDRVTICTCAFGSYVVHSEHVGDGSCHIPEPYTPGRWGPYFQGCQYTEDAWGAIIPNPNWGPPAEGWVPGSNCLAADFIQVRAQVSCPDAAGAPGGLGGSMVSYEGHPSYGADGFTGSTGCPDKPGCRQAATSNIAAAISALLASLTGIGPIYEDPGLEYFRAKDPDHVMGSEVSDQEGSNLVQTVLTENSDGWDSLQEFMGGQIDAFVSSSALSWAWGSGITLADAVDHVDASTTSLRFDGLENYLSPFGDMLVFFSGLAGALIFAKGVLKGFLGGIIEGGTGGGELD